MRVKYSRNEYGKARVDLEGRRKEITLREKLDTFKEECIWLGICDDGRWLHITPEQAGALVPYLRFYAEHQRLPLPEETV